jgi:WD40 repeat protein
MTETLSIQKTDAFLPTLSQTFPIQTTETIMPTVSMTPLKPPTKTSTPLPSQTLTPTYTISPTQTLTPSTTPPPGQFALSVSNVQQISQLAKWGKGTLRTTAWSPDGRIFAVASSLGVHLYDPGTLKEKRFINTNETVTNIAFSRDGKVLATGNKGVRLWDTATGASLGALPGKVQGWITYLTFSPGGSMVAALGIDGSPGDPPSRLFVWDVASYQTRYIKDGPGCGYGNNFTFSPDGRTIAYTVCGYVSLLNAATGEELPITIHDDNSTTTIFTPDGKYLLMGSNVVDVGTGDIVRTMQAELDYTTNIFTPDGKSLILECVWDDQQGSYVTQVWNFETDTLRFSIPDGGSFGPHSLRPDGLELATIVDNTVQFWSMETGKATRQITWESTVSAITFGYVSLDGQGNQLVLVTGDVQGMVRLYNPESGELVKAFHVADFPIDDVAVHPSGNLLGITTVDGEKINLLIYNLMTERKERTIPVSSPYDIVGTWGLAFSQDGEAIAVKTSPFITNTDAWIVHTGEKLQEPQRKTWYNAVDFASVSNGHIILVDYQNKQILDANTGVVLSSFTDINDIGMCPEEEHYVVSPDLRFFVLGCDTDEIHVWDLTKQIHTYSLAGHIPSVGDGWFGNITDLAFGPYGNLLASSGYDGTIRFWDVSNGQALLTIQEHTCTVTTIIFSPDGRYFASTSCDGTTRLWGLRK